MVFCLKRFRIKVKAWLGIGSIHNGFIRHIKIYITQRLIFKPFYLSLSKSEMEGREIIRPLHGNLITEMFIKPCCSKKFVINGNSL